MNPRPLRSIRIAHAGLVLPLAACTTFGAVRSAEVRPGLGATTVSSLSGRVDDHAAWFWNLDCGSTCGRRVPGVDAAVTYGSRQTFTGRPGAIAIGTSGVHPYVDGYLQLAGGARPMGIGGRVGLPLVGGWMEHQLYGRADLPIGSAARLLFNPAIFVHHGHSPNGQNRGSFIAFVQGMGLELDAGQVTLTPAISLVSGRSTRSSYGHSQGSAWTVFPTASLGISVHRAARP